VAAAQIYNMLSAYNGKVTVKIDGIAASAASVIAMAGDTVLVSPVSMLMIHNPATVAFGDHAEMQKAIDMLSEVKESIINAYVLKTGLSRARLSHLMDAETWMDANKAVELGFADGIIQRAALAAEDEEKEPDEEGDGSGDGGSQEEEKKKPPASEAMLFSRRAVNNALMNKLEKYYSRPKPNIDVQAQISAENIDTGRPVSEIMERLSFIKKFI
jgi:ATP-dependent Clp protease protease subunit